MAKNSMDLLELLRKRGMEGDVDFLLEALQVLVEGIIACSVPDTGDATRSALPTGTAIAAGTGTPGGDDGTAHPQDPGGELLPHPAGAQATHREGAAGGDPASLRGGVSTRRVDDLIKSLGCDGISKSQVSRICRDLDQVVETFLVRPLDAGPYPYVWLHALTQKVREGGRIANVSVVVATGVNVQGQREIIGMDVGTSEDGAFWLAFLCSLSARGLNGVELVISDAHQGLKNAIATAFAGAGWRRCRTHFMSNLLTRVPKRSQPGVAAMVRTIYQQLSPEEVHAQADRGTGK